MQVVYPALDAKVKNVTSAYSVEHEDEERLFEQLSALLSIAVRQDGRQRAATLRQLECKIEEVHTTLRKHLAKEEEQLFPLLLKHFTFAEQVDCPAADRLYTWHCQLCNAFVLSEAADFIQHFSVHPILCCYRQS